MKNPKRLGGKPPQSDFDQISIFVLYNFLIIAIIFFATSFFYNYPKDNPPKIIPKKNDIQTILEKDVNYNEDVSQEENFVCPEDEPSPKVRGIYDTYSAEEYRQFVSHGCEKTLFDISLNSLSDVFYFMGKEFGTYTTKVDRNTKVRSIFFPRYGQALEEDNGEININLYIQNIWRGEPFTANEVVEEFLNQNQSAEIVNKFEDYDSNKDRPIYFVIEDEFYPEEKRGVIRLTKFGTTDNKAVYGMTYSIDINGDENTFKSNVSDWLEKNSEEHLQALKDVDFYSKEGKRTEWSLSLKNR